MGPVSRRRLRLRRSEPKANAFWIRTKHREDLKVTLHQKECSLSSSKLNLGILQQPTPEVAAGRVCLSESARVCVCVRHKVLVTGEKPRCLLILPPP